MATIKDESRYAQTAQAAYAVGLVPNSSNVARYREAGMSEAQALQFDGCHRLDLDAKLEELCRKDAGVRVYERVNLNSAEYAAMRKYSSSRDRENYYGPEYRYVHTSENLVGTANDALNGKGRLMRWHSAIYRRSNGRLLGESVDYGRTGGDGILEMGREPTNESCSPRVPDLGQTVFVEVK